MPGIMKENGFDYHYNGPPYSPQQKKDFLANLSVAMPNGPPVAHVPVDQDAKAERLAQVSQNCSMEERDYRIGSRNSKLMEMVFPKNYQHPMFVSVQNKAKECFYYFNRFTLCVAEHDYDNEAPECAGHYFEAQRICPSRWISQWNDLRVEGMYYGLGNKVGGIEIAEPEEE